MQKNKGGTVLSSLFFFLFCSFDRKQRRWDRNDARRLYSLVVTSNGLFVQKTKERQRALTVALSLTSLSFVFNRARPTVLPEEVHRAILSPTHWNCGTHRTEGKNERERDKEHSHSFTFFPSFFPHSSSPPLSLSRSLPAATCGSTDSVWACLHCVSFGCGRSIEQHALLHYKETQHPLVFKVSDGLIYW